MLDTVMTPILFLLFGRKPLERLLTERTATFEPAQAF
jgi:HME family heavy-metal exporter